MTVAVNDTIERYVITGAGPYAYTWRIFNDTDLQVYALSTTSPPVPAPLTYLTHYTVAGANDSSGGSITLTAAAIAAYTGFTLDIRANTPEDQPTSIRNQARFLPEIHEDAYDYLSRQIQDLNRRQLASIHLADNELLNCEVEPATTRKGKYLFWDTVTGAISSALSLTGTVLTQLIFNAYYALTDSHKRTAAEITAGITPTDYSFPSHVGCGFVLPERYGSVGNGNAADLANAALDTAAINTAITIASATGCPILLSRAYIAIPATAQAGAANYNCAFALKSGVTFLGHNGGSIKMQNGYSTNGSPKEMAMFSTSVALSKVSWIGLLMDMNGANNLMSPARPVTYNAFNHAAIMANGPTGLINDVRIQDCTFQNNAGVCYLVAQLVAAGTTPVMGVRWTIKNNLFLNGGTDCQDLTAIFAWCEDCLIEGNIIWQDSPPHTVGLTGGASGFEVHGARTRAVNNLVYNYKLGCYVATNFTNKTVDVVVSNNQFRTTDYGVIFFRAQTGSQTEIDNVIVSDNNFYFDATTLLIPWSDGIATRVCVGFQGGNSSTNQLAVNNIKISGNLAIDNSFGSTALNSIFVRWDTVQNVANQVCSNISITDNEVIGFTEGVYILCVASGAANAQGFTEISNNKFISLSPDSGALYDVVGIKVLPNTGVKTLVIDGNQYIDERGVPSFLRGVLLFNSGTITDLCYGQQFFKGLTGASYTETGIVVTNRKGQWVTRGVTGAIATATATGHGLPAAPTQVMLQQLDGTPTGVFPSALGATQFTINFAGGGNHAFAWQASIGSQFP